MQHAIDQIDVRILRELQVDSSKSAVELASEVGISQSQCWRRIQQLKDSGYIKGQVTLLNRKQLGLNAQIFALIKLSSHGRANLHEFSGAIERLPEVLECYVLMGSFDFLLRVVAKDVEDYERFFFNNLSKLPGIQEVNSLMALSEVKATTQLPIPYATPAKKTTASIKARGRSRRT
jgi:Lrp/AsnC family transcriptional regulator